MSRFRRLKKLSNWRSVSLNAWAAPRDPTAYGTLDIDAHNALAYLEQLRADTGVKVTLTHLVGKAVADAIALRPEVNAVIRRGHVVYQRDTIDIFFQVAFDNGEDLSGATLRAVDKLSVVQIAEQLAERAARVRAHRDREVTGNSELLARLPGAVRGLALNAIGYLSYDLGLDLSALGLPFDAFGSAMVTNVGMFGLPQGLAPLVPFSRAPIVVTVGSVEPRPRAVDGEVVVRPSLSLGAALDHRLLDGYQAGLIARRLREILEDPARELA